MLVHSDLQFVLHPLKSRENKNFEEVIYQDTKQCNQTIKRNCNTQHLTSKSSIILCFSSSWLRRTATSADPEFCLGSKDLITLFAFSIYFLYLSSSAWNSASFRPNVSCNVSAFCSVNKINFVTLIQLILG